MQTLPAPYIELLRKIGPMNRVHNGYETARAVEELEAFCRKRLGGRVEVHAYKPGDTYNYWIVPRRWLVKHFSVTAPSGRVLLSRESHPLALCPNSFPFRGKLSKDDLLRNVIVGRSDLPASFPFHFRRMYQHWDEGWNIAMPYEMADSLSDGQYEVVIDTEFTDDPMLVLDYVAAGQSEDTVVLCGHMDHPGMVNDSLSGCVASLQVVEALEKRPLDFSYRVLILPEIIASAVYLKANESLVPRIAFALCPNVSAHDAPLAMCFSKSGNSRLDIAMRLALASSGREYVTGAFHKYPDCGDEISFDAVGYNIPTTTLSRIGEMFPFYHSSMDSTELFLSPEWQDRHQQFVDVLIAGFRILEADRSLTPTFRGNPCLSNPAVDLYLLPSNRNNIRQDQGILLDLASRPIDLRNFMEFFLDAVGRGGTTIAEIADVSNLPFEFVADYARRHADKGLIDLSRPQGNLAGRQVATTSLTLAGLV